MRGWRIGGSKTQKGDHKPLKFTLPTLPVLPYYRGALKIFRGAKFISGGQKQRELGATRSVGGVAETWVSGGD